VCGWGIWGICLRAAQPVVGGSCGWRVGCRGLIRAPLPLAAPPPLPSPIPNPCLPCAPPPSPPKALGLTSFCDPSDTLVLEDEGARLVLRGLDESALPVQAIVTGAGRRALGSHFGFGFGFGLVVCGCIGCRPVCCCSGVVTYAAGLLLFRCGDIC